ncbi:unnamed protein product [Adineta ricciae]|uniref:NAD(P)(+)--arginine ADP-ribosyltransferase n=1 Tax=Adineta ricciae TaxID=249248 RepID=A0A814A7V3_ADIRI|nr:unnamed protein product [Adineta ricciae]CAF1418534.1 unnamed protein product [Adineta ricciae]
MGCHTSHVNLSPIATTMNDQEIKIQFKNLEMFILLWVDENLHYESQFRQIINQIKTFEDPSECQKYLEDESMKMNKYVVIISGSAKTRQLIMHFHDLQQITSCYVFCQENLVKLNQQWAQNFSKIKGVFNNIDDLHLTLSNDQKCREQIDESALPVQIYNRNSSLQSRNAFFLYFHLFIDVLFEMTNTENDHIRLKQDFIKICRENYQNNAQELAILNEFNETYIKEKAIWWYTRESCIYRLLNKALRLQDISTLFLMRFFIKDLYSELLHEYNHNLEVALQYVYRGQAIDVQEVKLIRENLGEFLSFNSFLSASEDRQISMNFAKRIPITSDLTAILFEFELNKQIKNTRPYAKIQHLSYFSEENEILIGLGSIFEIKEIFYDENEHIWICQMSLSSEDNYQLKDILQRDKLNIGNDCTSLGYLLYQMGDTNKAKEYFNQLLLNSQTLTFEEIASCYRGLAGVGRAENDYKISLEYHLKELDIYQKIIPPVPLFYIGDCYRCIGNIYRNLNDLDQALSYQEKALELLPEDHPSYPDIYSNIAQIYQDQDKTDLALEYFQKCISKQEILLPKDHPHIGSTYANIGIMYMNLFDSRQAIFYYEKARNILVKSRPLNHSDILQLEGFIQLCQERLAWEEQQIHQ